MKYYAALKMKDILTHATYNMDELGEHYVIQISMLQKNPTKKQTQLFSVSTYMW